MEKSNKFETIKDYIASFPDDIQAILLKTHEAIKKAAPQAEERMSWQMPTYHFHENLVHFAAQKNHLGFYPSPEGIEAFSNQLENYKKTKGGVQFPYNKPVPYALIEEITRFRLNRAIKKITN